MFCQAPKLESGQEDGMRYIFNKDAPFFTIVEQSPRNNFMTMIQRVDLAKPS